MNCFHSIWLLFCFLCLVYGESPNYEIILQNVVGGSNGLIGMKLRDHEFSCQLPHDASVNAGKDLRLESNELAYLEMMKNKLSNQCAWLMTGWWVYELCFGKYVRQFHQEKNVVTLEYFLGYQEKDGFKTGFHDVHLDIEHPESSYVSYLFDNGTKCDLTGANRTVEVRVYCPTDEILGALQNRAEQFFGRIEEPRSCHYVASYYSKHLCRFDEFVKKEQVANRITCQLKR